MNQPRTTLVAVLVGSIAILVIGAGAWPGMQRRQPVAGPKAVDNLRWVLRINGNRNRDEVVFDHRAHQERLDGQNSCSSCHHLYRPHDLNSPCYSCHADLTLATPIFSHSGHEQKLGGNDSCAQCHDLNRVKSGATAKPCADCHAENMGMILAAGGKKFNFMAPGYQDAMHELCVNCHRQQAAARGRPELPECDTCHQRVHHDPDEAMR